MRQLKNVWFIAVKDLRLFMTDRMALIFFILFPFLLIIMFNFLLGNVGGQDSRMQLHLVTLESDGISNQIIQAMQTKEKLRDIVLKNKKEVKVLCSHDNDEFESLSHTQVQV